MVYAFRRRRRRLDGNKPRTPQLQGHCGVRQERFRCTRACARRGGGGGARGGGGAAGGSNGRPPPPSSPSKATHTRSKNNTSSTVYRTDMLDRVVRSTILGASPWAKRSLNAIKVTLNEFVSKRVTRVRALRVRDFSLKEMYGEWTSGQISCISCYSSCIV